MKKQISILAVAFITVALFSCSKEKIETIQTDSNEEIATAKKPGGGGGNSSALSNKGLDALYEFNNNLKESTGNLAEAVPSINGAETFTEDRNGVPNNAILFTGRYTLDIFNVPVQTNMSVAAWVKYATDFFPLTHIVEGDGPTLSNENNKFLGLISTPMTTSVISDPVDNNWHHLVATYDGTNLKFYVDGNNIGSSFNPSPQFTGLLDTYHVGGWAANNWFWRGSMDDLRFYSRVLSATDVQKLYYQ